MKHIKIPLILKKMNSVFQENGYQAFLVGGALRDMVCGKTVADWDVATDATPEQVISIFPKVIPTGIAHGTVTVLFHGESIEVTTFRTESGYSDGRHPDKVEFGHDIEGDLSRRDFTMNAMAASLKDGLLVDPFNGQMDIKNKLIKTVGNPEDRFLEDGLRAIRGIRFSSQLGFQIEKATLEAIPKTLHKTFQISIERFRDEFIKILKTDIPSKALFLMEKTGILAHFIPELIECRNVIQADCRGFHQFDVLDHLFYACDGASKENLAVRLAALFHDIGKPGVKKTQQRDGQTIYTFFNHEKLSSKITLEIMTRLRFPKSETEYVCHLINNHMFHYDGTWSEAAIRRFIVRVTSPAIPDLFDLRIADVYGMTRTPPVIKEGRWSQNLIELMDRIKQIESKNEALCLKNLAVNGSDLIANGIPTGKAMGRILQELFETVLDEPECNTKENLLRIAINIAKRDGIII